MILENACNLSDINIILYIIYGLYYKYMPKYALKKSGNIQCEQVIGLCVTATFFYSFLYFLPTSSMIFTYTFII